MRYLTNCVNSTAKLIEDMIESAIEIKWPTFRKYVDIESLKELFPDYRCKRWDTGFLHIKNDYHVRYFKSVFKGKRCIFLVWSATEFIFI